MHYDLEIYRLADALLRKYGASALLVAAERAETESGNGDVLAELVWKAVLRAVEELIRTERRSGERLN
jgi:hypothetical protein